MKLLELRALSCLASENAMLRTEVSGLKGSVKALASGSRKMAMLAHDV